MGEKKRRLAAARSITPADMALNFRITQLEAECSRLENAIGLNPADHAALYQLALLRLQLSVIHRERDADRDLQGRELNNALNAITQAIQVEANENTYWRHFAECMKYASLEPPLDPRARDLLARAIEHPAVPPATLAAAIVSLLRSDPAIRSITGQIGANASGHSSAMTTEDLERLMVPMTKVLNEPLFHVLLESCVVADPWVEGLIVLARRAALAGLAATKSDTTALSTDALAALAHQCFATEYLYEVSTDESQQLAWIDNTIHERAASEGKGVPIHWLLLRACYGVLDTTTSAALKRASDTSPAAIARLAARLIDEPLRERELRESIPHSAPAGETSREVGQMYEEHPYPRWFRTAAVVENIEFRSQLQRLLPEVDFSHVSNERPRILVAGCGTGQHPIETARRFPGASVLAIDISLTSLAYAKRKTLELGIENIEYRQSDILALGSGDSGDGRFDLIESVGVLHHLENPLDGWRALRSLLNLRGLMRIGLYSEIAREEITQLCAVGRSLGLSPTIEGIRQLRNEARRRLPDQGVRSVAFSPDFYCTSGCRDLLFHPMEHRFDLPRIAEHLASLNLEFLGFWLPSIAIAERYRARFADDPLMRNLSHWNEFEQSNRWLFQGMYNFWSRARD
jgi:2-polyprenyl-3-methyl-5-hydroxy-6-metoxy-1,4-benzoquinol methylase